MNKERIEILLETFPKLRELQTVWEPIAVPADIPFDEHYRPALELLRMLTRGLIRPGKQWDRSERFENEIKFLSGDVAMYSGRTMSDYITRLEFPGIEERETHQTEFKIVYKRLQLSRNIFDFCANQWNRTRYAKGIDHHYRIIETLTR